MLHPAEQALPHKAGALVRAIASPFLPLAAAVLCIAAYAGQLGLGRWQADEFMLFARQHTSGVWALLPRLVYSPRPFSETVLFAYGAFVLDLGRPLIVPFLAILWAGVLGVTVLAACLSLPPSKNRLPVALALVFTLFAFVLATSPVTEMFYWPVAAAAYLPTVAACTALMFLLARPPGQIRQAGCGLALMVAAASSEMGAVLAIGFAGTVVLRAFLQPGGGRPRLGALLRGGTWWAWPGMLGLGVMAIILLVRASELRAGAETQAYGGHFALSAGAAVQQLALDLIGDGGSAPAAILRAAATKLSFAFGFAALWRQIDGPGTPSTRWHGVLASAIALAMFFSIAAALFHYGDLCCERQSTTRFWLADLLAIMGVRWALGRWWPVRAGGQIRGSGLLPVLLTLSLIPVLFRTSGLILDYGMLHYARTGVARTWRSGQMPNADRMELYLPPDGPGLLVHGTSVPVGTYHTGPGAPELANAIGDFFGKPIVSACQPWQTSRSWVIDGVFIPACPQLETAAPRP